MTSTADARSKNRATGNKNGIRSLVRGGRVLKNEGIIPQLALAVREVEASARRGKATPANRVRFQVVALLVREERARVRDGTDISEADRQETLKRLDGVANILASAASHDTSLIPLLQPDAVITDAALQLRKTMLEKAGVTEPEELSVEVASARKMVTESKQRQVVPRSIARRARANPFLPPPQGVINHETLHTGLANWELIAPLLKAFEQGGQGESTMQLPEAPKRDRFAPPRSALMPHQARLLASVRAGHREFLLADEPGLGKTAQSLLAASVAGAYPLLVVAPNVVKMNWAREAASWTPQRRVSVITGDGKDVNPFADIFIINYDILERHISWLAAFGFKGMVIDEAHMIKNVTSQRSRNTLELSAKIRESVVDPLLIALTGTPLINDIEDFRAIWQFLGWLQGDAPGAKLLNELEKNGYTPADGAFYPAARQSVIDLGIVRRRKIDVAKDLPAKRIIDLPVELDTDEAPDIKAAERQLATKLFNQFAKLKQRKLGQKLSTEQLIRAACMQEYEIAAESGGVSVFTMVRQIGLAKAELAADYAAQLARSVGKVVFFAKHIEVMDRAEEFMRARGLGVSSIRGSQSAIERQEAIDAFQNDPRVNVIVCSLTAAGVGVNLQASSNVVLAELSWTDAEQTQAIDRVHRIGQEEPVTAWRIIAAQTVDQKIAELIDSKAGLAARALDGAEAQAENSDPVQLRVLIEVLRQELQRRISTI
ncbi:DEAD/DEAH box helicase [Canibacter zhuwentaonis]|uniref:DEAD/DEAH box helicase n=1 Tax=Canibacter zhuwentaonis TaxID=2837491 RepID=UPI00350FDB8C